MIFDKNTLRIYRDRIAKNFDNYNFLFQILEDYIKEILADIRLEPQKVLQIGGNGDILNNTNILVDISQEMLNRSGISDKICCDEEEFCEGNFDMILSNLYIQFVNNFPQFLANIYRMMNNNGVFIASFIGGESLKELRYAIQKAELKLRNSASPRVAPFIDVKTAGMLMQKTGFANPLSESHFVKIEYQNGVRNFIKDLKFMGLGNILTKRHGGLMSRVLLDEMVNIYEKEFDGHEIELEVIILIGWKK